MQRVREWIGQQTAQRWIIILSLSLACSAAVNVARWIPRVSVPLQRLDDLLYDSFYRTRSVEDQSNGPVAIVAADDYSLVRMLGEKRLGWPWPRDQWAAVVDFARKNGAKAVVFDILFSEPSVYNRDFGDDDALAEAANAAEAAKIPVIFADMAEANSDGRFALPVHQPRLGAANLGSDSVLRLFFPTVENRPSVASATLLALGQGGGVPREPFLLNYYGPHAFAGGRHTFRYISVADVVDASIDNAEAVKKVDPSSFRDKIIIVGAITAGTYDLKVTPLSAIFPGVEVNATAIVNMLRHQEVEPVAPAWVALVTLLGPMIAAFGAGIPRNMPLKIVIASIGVLGPTLVSAWLFGGATIHWLPPAAPLIAAILAVIGALSWSYFIEDRERRFFLKALSQYLSPAVAEELSRNRSKLKIGSERREMTVVFTDIAGFTDMSETLQPEQLGTLLNRYLDAMSDIVLASDGTLDKYIGDGIMAFWNAPLDQPDHALRGCQAAMAMRQREVSLAGELAELGGGAIYTRIGVNSGPMAVGNMGSPFKFNYTAMGDAVNLGSRLEGANKMYGTRILLSESTAAAVKDHFLLRKIDLLRVKGKQLPVGVYEPLAELSDSAAWVELASGYETAWASYCAREWDAAQEQLRRLSERYPNDSAIAALSMRIEAYRHDPPPPDWDGVFVAKTK